MLAASDVEKNALVREKQELQRRSQHIGCRRAFWKRRGGHSEEVA